MKGKDEAECGRKERKETKRAIIERGAERVGKEGANKERRLRGGKREELEREGVQKEGQREGKESARKLGG